MSTADRNSVQQTYFSFGYFHHTAVSYTHLTLPTKLEV